MSQGNQRKPMQNIRSLSISDLRSSFTSRKSISTVENSGNKYTWGRISVDVRQEPSLAPPQQSSLSRRPARPSSPLKSSANSASVDARIMQANMEGMWQARRLNLRENFSAKGRSMSMSAMTEDQIRSWWSENSADGKSAHFSDDEDEEDEGDANDSVFNRASCGEDGSDSDGTSRRKSSWVDDELDEDYDAVLDELDEEEVQHSHRHSYSVDSVVSCTHSSPQQPSTGPGAKAQ